MSEEERIKNMYNEGAVAFKEYLKTRDIAKFTDDAAEIVKKYDSSTDVCGLMIWWSSRVQGLHDAYLGGAK